MDYDESYMLTHDIDWFCIVNGVYVHLASAGGLLPVGFRDREALRTLQCNVSVLSYMFEVDDIAVNEVFLNQRFDDNPKGREAYLVSFVDMARKGFVSLDRTNLTDPYDNRYHVVCRPRNGVERNIFGCMEVPALSREKIVELGLNPLLQIE